LLLVLSLAVVVLIPVTAVASHQFTDVPNANIFHGDISWLADNGVTKGCNPPANTMFCPEANVTRQQMAAFMHRLAVNKVVDAKTAVTADNANKLDGKDSTAFLGKTEKAADSNLLDGMDSTAFVPATALLPVASAMIDRRPGGAGDLVEGTGWSNATRVSTGVFCLQLDPSLGIDPTKVVVNATVEWGRSFGSELMAFWTQAAVACPAGEIEIRTYDTFGTLSDLVVFVATAFWSPNFTTYSELAGTSDGNTNN
jgi:hypothetical protein